MLPAPADLVAQHVHRARREIEVEDLRPLLGRIAAKAHAAGAAKRNSDHDAEFADVAVPAELGSGAVLGHQGMNEVRIWCVDELTDSVSERKQKRRNLGC